MKCLLINSRSIIGKIDELRARVNSDYPTIIAVTESWANINIQDKEIEIDGYSILRRDRLVSRGGGLLLYIKDNIRHEQLSTHSDIESIWCKLYSGKTEMRLGLYYRPPNSDGSYLEKMCCEIKSLCKNHTLVMGDFNMPGINWETFSSPPEFTSFRDLCLDHYFFQHVKEPTRHSNILDLVLSNDENLISNIETQAPLSNSDHQTIMFELNFTAAAWQQHRKDKTIKTFRFSDIKQDLSFLSKLEQLEDKTSQQLWNLVTSSIESACSRHCKIRSKRKLNSPPWLDGNIKVKISQKKKAWKKYKNSGEVDKLYDYKLLEKEVKRLIKGAKNSFERKLTANISGNPKAFYAYASGRKTSSQAVSSILKNTKEITDSEEIANELNSYFSSVYTIEDIENWPSVQPQSSHTELTVVDVTEERVMKKLENLNVSKAPGPDGISPRLLKECKHELVTPLTQIFQKSLSEGKVIDVWKKAVVTPLYKKGKKSSVDSYRPVSLTSVPCKILESIIKDQLVEYLQKHSIIAPSQHGFTSGRSCLTNLTEFLEFVTNQLDHKTPVDAIYLDFSKAFDKVPHKRLLLKLKGIGIKGQLLEWITDWLSNRSQQVQVKGSLSDWAMVKSGVPQGSVLGPVLFLIYVNDRDEKVTCNISKFTDDTKIYDSVPNREAARMMQNDLNKMYEWCKDWQVELNVGKRKVMHFGKTNECIQYFINNTELISCTSEKDLGVIVCDNLKPSKHIDEVVLKANRIIGPVNRTVES